MQRKDVDWWRAAAESGASDGESPTVEVRIETRRGRRLGAVPHLHTDNPQTDGLSVSHDQVHFHQLYTWTVWRLDGFGERVAENRGVMEALEFARYVLNSNLVEVLEVHSCEGPLKVDGAFLRWKAKELQRACQERFRFNDVKPHLEGLQVQSINQKLDRIAGYLSKLAVLPPAVVSVGEPDLKVMPGGLNGRLAEEGGAA